MTPDGIYDDRHSDMVPPLSTKAAPMVCLNGSPEKPCRILRLDTSDTSETLMSTLYVLPSPPLQLFPLSDHGSRCNPHIPLRAVYVSKDLLVDNNSFLHRVLGKRKAQFVGDKIHQLTPSTTLRERCDKYIETLHMERPDPPAQDEPYEYPFTQPCIPGTGKPRL
jgi:hypothetical protein